MPSFKNTLVVGASLYLYVLGVAIESASAKCGDFSTDVCDNAGNFVHKQAPPANVTQDNLIDASEAGNLSRVQALLAAKADVDAKGAGGGTPLMYAAQNNHVAVVEALLKAKADVNIKNDNGGTVLSMASYNGRLAVVQVLLGAKTANAETLDGALLAAAQIGHLDVMKALLAAKANVSAHTPTGATPFYLAAINDHIEVARALLAAKADVNAKTTDGDTALIVASAKGNLKMVQTLLDAKADVNAAKANGVTALIWASQQGHLDVVRTLLAAGANVNAVAANGDTALGLATQFGNPDVVRFLGTVRGILQVAQKKPSGSVETLAAQLATIDGNKLTLLSKNQVKSIFFTDKDTIFCVNNSPVSGIDDFQSFIGKTVTFYTTDPVEQDAEKPRYVFRVEDDTWIKDGAVEVGGQRFTRVLKSPHPGEPCGPRQPMPVGGVN